MVGAKTMPARRGTAKRFLAMLVAFCMAANLCAPGMVAWAAQGSANTSTTQEGAVAMSVYVKYADDAAFGSAAKTFTQDELSALATTNEMAAYQAYHQYQGLKVYVTQNYVTLANLFKAANVSVASDDSITVTTSDNYSDVPTFTWAQACAGMWYPAATQTDFSQSGAVAVEPSIALTSAEAVVAGNDSEDTANIAIRSASDDDCPRLLLGVEPSEFSPYGNMLSNRLAKSVNALYITRAQNNPNPAPAEVDKTALGEAIAAAKASAAAVKVSADGSEYTSDIKWVTKAEMDAFEAAISAAQAVMDDVDETQAGVNSAVGTLNAAVGVFEAAQKAGTKPSAPDPGPNPSPDPDPDPVDPGKEVPLKNVERIAGDESVDTAAAISKATFTTASTVVVATKDGFADAMSATGLAGLKGAPILLTEKDKLSAATQEEVLRLGATEAYVIGGTAVVSDAAEAQLKALLGDGGTVTRIAGNEAEDTAALCAQALASLGAPSGRAIVASSYSFQDALSISSFAYKHQVPILLQSGYSENAQGRHLSQGGVALLTSGYYKDATVYVPGGYGAVSYESCEGTLGAHSFVRMYGNTAYDTSNEIAKFMVSNGFLSADNSIVACGATAAGGTDALAGAAMAGVKGAALVLANGNSAMEAIDTTTIDGFIAAQKASIRKAYALGGNYVMPVGVLAKIDAYISVN